MHDMFEIGNLNTEKLLRYLNLEKQIYFEETKPFGMRTDWNVIFDFMDEKLAIRTESGVSEKTFNEILKVFREYLDYMIEVNKKIYVISDKGV